ncbi:MAG: hypothetical protein IPQ16_14170 [Geobacteraceae bacterium]|nr:hypothetical protein [Geobacteraceae bacterium]
MNKILTVITNVIIMATFTTAVIAVETPATVPTVPTAPKTAATKATAAETTAKHRKSEKEARAAKAAAAAKKTVVAEPPAEDAIEAARSEKLRKRNKDARRNSKATGTGTPKENTPVIPPTAK